MIRGLGGVAGGAVFPGAGGVNVASGGGGVHADLPGKFSLLLGVGKQPGVHVLPHPVGPEADEQVVDPPPGAVAFGDVAPRAAGAGVEEDAVDQGSWVPGAGSSPARRCGQEWGEESPFGVGEVMPCRGR